jgi:hypothetical protein
MPGKTSLPSPENLNLVLECIDLFKTAKKVLSDLPEYCPDRKKLIALKEARECLDLLARISKK